MKKWVKITDWELVTKKPYIKQKAIKVGKSKKEQLARAFQSLQFIAEEDREEAKRIMEKAISLGWTSIGFWEGWSKDENDEYQPNDATIHDMFGVRPDSYMGCFINDKVLDERINDLINIKQETESIEKTDLEELVEALKESKNE